MSTRGVLFLLLGIFFLVGAAAATDLTNSAMTSSNTGWIVANGNDQVTITVHVSDGPKENSLQGATVDFSLADDSKDLGTLSAPNGVTGTDGIAQTIFKTTTKSGTATIKALVTYTDGSGNPPATITLSCVQKIDHGRAQPLPTADYPYSVPAGSVAHVNVTFMDRYNNLVDNKNPDTVHTVHISIQDDGGPIFSGAGDPRDRYLPTDAYGNISFDVQVSTEAGSNNIQVYGLEDSHGIPITIESAADSVPCYLVQMPPNPNTYPADGKDEHSFTLYYTVLDKYHNPLGRVELLVTSSQGEEARIITNDNGKNYTYYGPKDVAKMYTITAAPVITGTKSSRNATILCMDTGETGFCTQTVTYTTLDPTNMILTASPQTMVSWDVAGASKVNVNARVVDDYGNGVKDQTVTFTKSPDTATGFTETAQSDLSPLSGTTDGNGYAVVKFQPGTFTKDKTDLKYSDAATGSCKVTAKWTNPKTGEVKSRDITFVWKNYPFLSVDSAVDKTDPQVGDTINVKVWIRGTGAALQPKPIDVVLVMDRSGSMLRNYPGRPDDAMVEAQAAALKFSQNLNTVKDHIGIVSFGGTGVSSLAPVSGYWGLNWNQVYGYWYWVANDNANSNECGSNHGCYSGGSYSPDSIHQKYLNAHYNKGVSRDYGSSTSRTDLTLNSHTSTDVDAALKSIVPAGGTPMRDGLNAAVNLFPTDYTDRPVRAIILLTDGNFDTDPNQDPEGSPNAIVAAQNHKIKIYTIGLGSGVQGTSLEKYAKDTGGIYYPADDPSKLDEIYTKIAGELNEQAGGQTQVIADFSKITVDGHDVLGTGVDSYLAYNYNNAGLVESSSTFESKTSTNVPVDTTKNDYYTTVRDDRDNWTSPKLPGLTARKLQFDVGKIILNDVWETNIQFKLTGEGVIQILGDNCPITFIDMSTNPPKTQTVNAPQLTWTTHKSKVNDPFAQAPALTVKVVSIADDTTDPNLWTVTWKTTYEGASTVREKLQYCIVKEGTAHSCSYERKNWDVYPQSIPSLGKVTDRVDTLVVDTSTWTPGEKYKLSIWAETDDGQTNWDDAPHTKEDGSKKAYINLQ